MYWTPSSTVTSVQPGTSATIAGPSNQIEGVARVLNFGGSSTAIVAIASVSASAGELNYTPISPTGEDTLFIAYAGQNLKIVVSNSTCLYNTGYALK